MCDLPVESIIGFVGNNVRASRIMSVGNRWSILGRRCFAKMRQRRGGLACAAGV